MKLRIIPTTIAVAIAVGSTFADDSRHWNARDAMLADPTFPIQTDEFTSHLERALKTKFEIRAHDATSSNLRGRQNDQENDVIDVLAKGVHVKRIELSTDEFANEHFQKNLEAVLHMVVVSNTLDGDRYKATNDQIVRERRRIREWVNGPAVRAALTALESTPVDDREETIPTHIVASFDSVRVSCKTHEKTGKPPSFTFVITLGVKVTGILPGDE